MHLLKPSGGAFVAFAWIAIMQEFLHAQQACEDLKKLALDHVTITSAVPVEAGPLKQPPGAPFKQPEVMVPSHCEVAGVARPTSDSEINFLLWLPPASLGMANTCSAATAAGPARFGRPRCPVP